MESGELAIKKEPESPPETPQKEDRGEEENVEQGPVKREPESPPESSQEENRGEDEDEDNDENKDEDDDENKDEDDDENKNDRSHENDDDEESSDGECAGTPIREADSQDGSENENSKGFEFSSKSSPERKPFTTAMEGELDFEDEVAERKEEISKDIVYEDSQKEIESEEKYMNKEKDADEDKEPQSSDEEEDGQLSPEKLSKDDKLEEGSMEEGEDDGEISDDDDLEEGEVKDSTPAVKQPTRQVCRFFNRGQCTWGTLCRFLHLSVNDRGNYNMFAPSTRLPPPFPPPGNGMGMGPHPGPGHLGQRGPRNGPEYHPPPPPPPPPPPANDAPAVESSWERGLRHAKEMMKKASRRKEQEPDFEEKRLNLSLDENERVTSEYDKENEYFGKQPHRRNESQSYNRYDEPSEPYDNGEREAREHWRGGRYENFEIRWTRQDNLHKDRREKDRQRNTRVSIEREKFPKQLKGKERWRDDRLSEIQTSRPRADEWRDPWRRSKTPKGRRSRSRGRSRGSYSSVSSHSYSDRTSRSSRSYSRSSSRSSFYSSKSPSPSRTTQKRKPPPRKEATPPPKPPTNRVSAFKRKPVIPRRTRSRSYTRSRSSHSLSRSRSSSSRSRSITRTPSVSRSRSYSRSLSMDSVSSASSRTSHSSSGSGSLRNRNAHVSILRKEEVKPPPPKVEVKTTTSSLFEEMQRLKQYDKMREREKSGIIPEKITPVTSVPPREKKVVEEPVVPVQYIQPPSEKVVKEPLKHSLHKQQIKLTLLNKASTKSIPNALKREAEAIKAKLNEKEEPVKPPAKVGTVGGIKRPLSPTTAAVKPAAAVPPKRSTSSRRDELLKQLKAVEDAIARKRAKFS